MIASRATRASFANILFMIYSFGREQFRQLNHRGLHGEKRLNCVAQSKQLFQSVTKSVTSIPRQPKPLALRRLQTYG